MNDENVPIEADENGAILIPVAERESKIRLVFREPYFVRIANYVSLLFG